MTTYEPTKVTCKVENSSLLNFVDYIRELIEAIKLRTYDQTIQLYFKTLNLDVEKINDIAYLELIIEQ